MASALRSALNAFKRVKPSPQSAKGGQPKALLEQDNLFHLLSQSPVPEMRAKGERIKSLAYCPVSLAQQRRLRKVEYECPNCGYPTHYSKAEWAADTNHAKYWPRLREANEDEHDLRSGRAFPEFELPGEQPYEEAVSFSNWDVFFFTRGFGSINSDRSIRHVSKILSFPTTIGAVLHESSPYNMRNQRLTADGLRSLTALRQTLHPEVGAKPAIDGPIAPTIRIFILGARAESSLPAPILSQLSHLFPTAYFHLFMVGPEATLPSDGKDVSSKYNCPANLRVLHEHMSVTVIQSLYEDVHDCMGSFDPYTDVFFAFSPGLGFPSVAPTPQQELNPADTSLVSTSSLNSGWTKAIYKILETKCCFFGTGFSPRDIERDILALDDMKTLDDENLEFDWILTPGENVFASQKWEVLEQDPRVMVKSNFGVWGVRGKMYEVRDQNL